MCAEKRSSASEASGETRTATMSASPEYQHATRQPGHGTSLLAQRPRPHRST